MSANSSIEWTDDTWNPIRARNRATGKVGWFCIHASDGCRHCYAEGFNHRLGTGVPYRAQNLDQVELFLDEETLTQPLRWKRPRRVFVCSMTDLFADFVPDSMIESVFAIMALAPQHTFQVLTKRPDRMRTWFGRPDLPDRMGVAVLGAGYRDPLELLRWPLPNVWLGTSVEDQRNARRIADLLAIPAAIHFLSAEPLIGGLDLTNVTGGTWQSSTLSLNALTGHRWRPGRTGGVAYTFESTGPVRGRLDWVIVGPESGPHARPAHPAWVRQIRNDCEGAGIPFFFKQWGAHRPMTDADPDGAAALAIAIDGTIDRIKPFSLPPTSVSRPRWAPMVRDSKTANGRLLDGRTHDDMPGRGS